MLRSETGKQGVSRQHEVVEAILSCEGLIGTSFSFRDAAILKYLKEQGIRHVDALPALISCFEKGVQPYKVSIDGHPNVLGNIVVAEAVWHEIADMKTSWLHN